MSRFQYSVAIVLSLPLVCTVAPASAATQSAQSNFVHAETLPWQTLCAWNDADGKARKSQTEGFERPGKNVVPESATCRHARRFTFPGGAELVETRYQSTHPVPVQAE